MKTRRYIALAVLALLLGACASRTSPPPVPPLGEADVVVVVRSLLDDIGSISDPDLLAATLAAAQLPIGRPGCPTFPGFELPAMQNASFSPQSFIPPEGTVLTRGTFRYDPTTGVCRAVQDTDKLVLHYPYRAELSPDGFAGELRQARLTVDWGETLDVAAPSGALVEVPTAARFKLKAEGRKVADLSLALDWFNSPTCGSDDGILELTSLRLNGRVGALELDGIGFELSAAEANFSGALRSPAGIEAEFALRVRGELTRQPCFSTFAAERGSFSFRLASTVTPDSHSLSLETDFRDPVFARFPLPDLGEWMDDMGQEDWLGDKMMGGMFEGVQGLESVVLENGVLRVDDALAARFSGVLDDANADGVSGDAVTIVFADGGETTLQAFLTDNDFGVEFRKP